MTDRLTRSLRIVIADDHEIWLSGLRADLGQYFTVVAAANDATEAIEAIRRERPDLALVDLHMGGGGGLAVVRACAAEVPIVILTVSEAERDLLDAVAAGAVGFLTKSTRSEELRIALHRAVDGEPVFSPQLAALVLGEFRRLATSSPPEQALSPREREIVGLVARGHPYRTIAEELFISPKTVENHVRNIMAKLHLSRRHELIRWAVDRGIE
ncbi:MAG TPA: response regulator transcription factor [Microthrixaceae bacterium]|nr:response regulator transcription factor [Microthrixaceae bacterium]